jgi:hemerythrin
MPLMEWKPDYSVGVPEFDNDHRHLMQMLNDLNDAMREKKGRAVIGLILSELLKYTERHFGAEEAAMKRSAYPHYEIHRAQHRELTERVRAFASEYALGDSLISVEVLYFLREWLESHILKSDLAYRECLAGARAIAKAAAK